MSTPMPQGLRDCLTLSLSVHGTTWTSTDGQLSLRATDRITRTARDFVTSESAKLGIDNPADDALFKALLNLTNTSDIDATTVNPDLNKILGELMEALVGGPALDAADLAEHMSRFQSLGRTFFRIGIRRLSTGTRHSPHPLSSKIKPKNFSIIFFNKRLFR